MNNFTKNDLEEILALSLKNGGEFADIFIEHNKSTRLICEDNKIEKISQGTEIGAGIRVIDGLDVSYFATNDLSAESLKKAAQKAAEGMKAKQTIKEVQLKDAIIPKAKTIKKSPDKISLQEKIYQVELANKTVRNLSSDIKQVTVIYADTMQNILVANSAGLFAQDERVRTRFAVNAIAAKDNILQTGFEGPGMATGFEIFEKHPAAEVSRVAGERALLMLNAKHAPAGKMPVVLSSEAGGTMIHEACGHSLEADFIMKGTSIFTDKLGKKVASDLVTVIDDATLAGNFGSYSVDDEGTPAQKTLLIENGILKGFLCDRYNSQFLKIRSTGNGRRESFRTKPVPRMTNTYIAPGKSKPEDIINSIDNGLLVKKMGGGQVDITNGDFVFEVTEGYLIEKGQVKHPVRGAVLTGNGPEILNIIDMVGSDLYFMPGVCGKYDHAPVSDAQPTLRIPSIVVGGR